MAEDDDGASNKKSQKDINEESSKDNEQTTNKPDLGIEATTYANNENGVISPNEALTSSSKSTSATRKEENPFSFRHFLKRDWSLPGNSTYESTGARPKVYASTVQHSPNKIEVHSEPRRDKSRPNDAQAKERNNDSKSHRTSENTSSSSSVEIPFSVVDNSDSKQNLYTDSTEAPIYHRPNLATEPMPSLPDFVQDHILVEQTYLNSNVPISVDLDNLPDFTFNINSGSSSVGRQNKNNYSGARRGYGYESHGAASTSDYRAHERNLPRDPEPCVLEPLIRPDRLRLDLTESAHAADRRHNTPRSTFPLDLPPNAGAEPMILPDFLPVHPGRTSPEPEHQDEQLQSIIRELESTRSELFNERGRRSRLDGELASARGEIAMLRQEIKNTRANEAALKAKLKETRKADSQYAGQLENATIKAESHMMNAANRAVDAESTVAKLKNQIKKLKEELSASQELVLRLRGVQGDASADLRRATSLAETSLRELLAGLEQLKSLSSTLDQT